ncbi:hypothetical protein AAFC00_004995 [Neodothiora populina]|uniref:Protein N-terminal and lysine N-methyltransferase EFM7 n=1 Tax=Neodothiora populina TaxID=2781224 RepID=A0ABR3P5A6_9PEZI
MSDASSEVEDNGLFHEPEDFYEPEKQPTFESHKLLSGRELNLRLVGHNPLWGHHLWNAGRVFANYLESHPSTIASKTVLELGAGAGLPSLMSAILGAEYVLVTDYPDADLIENLEFNIEENCKGVADESTRTTSAVAGREVSRIEARGYLWGANVEPLLSMLPSNKTSFTTTTTTTTESETPQRKFDILILADLLFNHSEHTRLLQTVQQTLTRSEDARALVFFTPYRPWLLEKDLSFFELAASSGAAENGDSSVDKGEEKDEGNAFVVEKIFEKVMDKVMFEEDRGDELLRRTVYGYELRWKHV